MRQRTVWTTISFIAVAVVLLDQLTKRLIVDSLGPGQAEHRRELLGSWLALEYVENRGAAFGLFANAGAAIFVLVAIGFVILAAALRRVARPSGWFLLAAGLVAGGAAGNAIDRIRLGYVVDFVAVSVWWRFNIADSSVTIGVVILVLLSMQSRDRQSLKGEEST